MTRRTILACLAMLAGALPSGGRAPTRGKPYRLKTLSVRQRVLWSAECRRSDAAGLAFGGQDQESPDGRPHTRVLVGGQWRAIHQQLRRANPLQQLHGRAWRLRCDAKDVRTKARFVYFRGLSAEEEARRVASDVRPGHEKLAADIKALVAALTKASPPGRYESGQVAAATGHLKAAGGLWPELTGRITPEAIRSMRRAQVRLALAAEALDAEPPARALSPIVFDEATGLYVLFGGDHLDYLTGDTWVFDPAAKRWRQRHPKAAPAPRARHTLAAAGDGTVRLTGGYTYTSNTDYCGGQYIDLDDGAFVYDVKADAWRGGKLLPPDSRTYRTGPFHPGFYLQGPRPDAAAFEARLARLPANEWVATDPPYRPRLNRDWGTAVLDTDRDMMLRWSGGHSAHGGTDVPHYHFPTNRWELAFPVEFPLGQLYSNTSYPKGYNLSRRPGMTGHTYQDYAYDPLSRRMVQTGHREHFYVYDPDKADWVDRAVKPKGMQYNSCFYDLTLCTTPTGVICWTKYGKLYRYAPDAARWSPVETTGEKLPHAAVDHSTLVYDAAGGRVLFFAKRYGKTPYDGQVFSLDLKTLAVASLSPKQAAGAGRIAWIDRACCEPGSGLVLLATYLKSDPGGWSRTPAYDPAGNRWVSLKLKYGLKKRYGRWRRLFPNGHSAGVMHDPKRKLLWGTDTNSQVYVLKLDAAAADIQPLE